MKEELETLIKMKDKYNGVKNNKDISPEEKHTIWRNYYIQLEKVINLLKGDLNSIRDKID